MNLLIGIRCGTGGGIIDTEKIRSFIRWDEVRLSHFFDDTLGTIYIDYVKKNIRWLFNGLATNKYNWRDFHEGYYTR